MENEDRVCLVCGSPHLALAADGQMHCCECGA